MQSIIHSIKRIFPIISVLLFFCLNVVQAQSICENTDCPAAIFDIPMNEPSKPADGNFSKERTKNFQEAWMAFQQLTQTYRNNPVWKSKYSDFQLAGKNCLRHYQLESYFAYEYLQNKDFKIFINSQGVSSTGFVKKGFNSNRRALNLEKRLQMKCEEEAKSADNKNGDLPTSYMALGKELGYFDETGNMVKNLEAIPPQNTGKLSKKEQVEQLSEKVNKLPVGEETTQKIANIQQDLKDAKPKANKLGNFLKTMIPLAVGFLLPQTKMLAGLGKIAGFLDGLLNWKPKFPKLGLFDKLKGLFNKGKKLKDKAQTLVDNAGKVKDKFEDLGKRAALIEDGINERIKNVTDLQDELDQLKREKDKLVAQLADKPKSILEELTSAVADVEEKADNLVNKVEDELKAKDELLKKLDELEKEKDALLVEKEQLEKEAEKIAQEKTELETETKEVEKEVEAAQKEEEELEKATKELEELVSEEELKDKITICEDDLKKLYDELLPIQETQNKLKEGVDKVKAWPGRLLDKITGIKLFQKQLKDGTKLDKLADKTLGKLNELTDKASAIGSIVEILTGKKSKLQEQVESIGQKVDKVQEVYDSRTEVLAGLKDEAVKLMLEKSGIKEQLSAAEGSAEDMQLLLNNYLDRFKIFDGKTDCISLTEMEAQVEEIKEEQKVTEPELEELEKELEKAERETTEVEAETEEVKKEIEEEVEKIEELDAETETIKEEFGKEVDLVPVTVKEWTESFEVKREYWDAVFHPDNEVVEGYKGKYFQVKLKDADKNIKLLFGPGEYFMNKSDFRDKYGSVIGAFVAEALNSMKKGDRGKVKLFVQGSADIVGQNTFKGKLDSKFMYEQVTVLPINPETDGFFNTPANKSIPKDGFTNTDLPTLRGNFLKEMISVYSKKLEPILLEGGVKKVENIADRNAVIYLFIPDELVDKYED